MKKTITLIMAAFMLFMLIGCSEPKEQVDEEDMSRWIVEFISEEDSDMENGRLEITVEELINKWKSGDTLKISFQWYDKFIVIGNADFEFALLPELTIYYINDAGKRVKDGALNDDKYYGVRDGKEKYDEDEGVYESVSRVVMPGTYRIKYALKRNYTDSLGDPNNYLATFYIEVFIGNINEEGK